MSSDSQYYLPSPTTSCCINLVFQLCCLSSLNVWSAGTFESPLLGHSPVRALLVNVHVGHLKSLHLSKRRADVAPLHHVSKTNISTSIAARSRHNAGTSIADLARHWKFDVKRSGVQGACLKLLCDQRQPDIMVAASNDEVVGMVHTSVRAASMYLALLNIYIM